MADERSDGSVPLITLPNRHHYSQIEDDHTLDTDIETSYPGPSYSPKMDRSFIAAQARPRKRSRSSALMVASSYVFDWIIILAMLAVSFYVGNRPPNRRYFFLEDPNIS